MSSNGIKNVVGFVRECAEKATALRDKYSKDRKNFLVSVGQVWDVSGPNPLIDPAYRVDQYAYAVEDFAKKGSEEFARQWAVRAKEALENALRIAEVDPSPVIDGLMTKYEIWVAQGELGAYMEDIKQYDGGPGALQQDDDAEALRDYDRTIDTRDMP